MKKSYAIPLCAIMFALGSAAALRAADYGSPAAAPSNTAVSPAATQGVSGTVQDVDTTKKSVQIKDDSGTVQTLQVNAGTQISKDGNPILLAQLKKGDIVTVRNAGSNM